MSAESRPEYHHALRSTSSPVWRTVAAIGGLAIPVTGIVFAALPVGNMIDKFLLGSSPNAGFQKGGILAWTPGLLLANNLLLSSQIPIAMYVQYLVYKRPT